MAFSGSELEKKPPQWEIRWRSDSRKVKKILNDGFDIRNSSKDHKEMLFCNVPEKAISLSKDRHICALFPIHSDDPFSHIYCVLVDTNNNNFCHFHRAGLSRYPSELIHGLQRVEFVKEDTMSCPIPPEHVLFAIPIRRLNLKKDVVAEDSKYFSSYEILQAPIMNEKAVSLEDEAYSFIRNRIRIHIKEIEEEIKKEAPLNLPYFLSPDQIDQLAYKHAFFTENRFQLNDLKMVTADNHLKLYPLRNLGFFKPQYQNVSGVIFSSQEQIEKQNELFFNAVDKSAQFELQIEKQLPQLIDFISKSNSFGNKDESIIKEKLRFIEDPSNVRCPSSSKRI
jgi:hypothetical protein